MPEPKTIEKKLHPEPIEIEQVKNGYIIKTARDYSRECGSFVSSEQKVFQSKKELLKHIGEYFSFEIKTNIEND